MKSVDRTLAGLTMCRFGLFGALMLGAAAQMLAAPPSWIASVSKDSPGDFPPPRPLHATYVFGWSGITAATAEVQFSLPPTDRCQIQGSGRTIGFVRALWRYDVNYRAVANVSTLRPIEANQADAFRSKKINTYLLFSNTGVRRTRTETPSSGQPRSRDFNFPNLYDLQTAMLYLRSQPLQEKKVYQVVVYPATNAYLAIATVLGREKVSVRAGNYNAFKIDLQLKRIGKDLELQPHRKFGRATVWVSDDADRLILRIEAQVFVGTVFAELQSVRFDEPRQ